MRLSDGRCLNTATGGIRTKWPPGTRTPLYLHNLFDMISSNDPTDSIFIHCLKQILERFLFLGFSSIHYYFFVTSNSLQMMDIQVMNYKWITVMKQWCQLHTLYNSQLENKLLFLTQQEQVLKDDGADSYWVEIGWHYSKGYIDVGDGCWRRNVLVTISRCWWRFWPFRSPTISVSWH